MNDLELADALYECVTRRGSPTLFEEQWQQIIAALRRGPDAAFEAEKNFLHGKFAEKLERACSERPPSGEMVMVSREPTDAIVWAICEHSDAPIDRERCLRCPAKEPTYYGEGTRGCRALAEDQFRAALSAAEAEGRKS